MKEQSGSEKKKGMSKEKKFYLFTAIGCAAVLFAIIVVAIAVTNSDKLGGELNNSSIDRPIDSAGGNNSSDTGVNGGNDGGNDGNDEPVINTPEGMTMPVSTVSVVNDYGFYHNTTLNNYYEHRGVDFSAAVGAEVYAVNDGVVESIYRDDILTGTEITVDHGDGVKSVYRFVTVADGLIVGTEVKRGDVIATVAEATGEEYKDGAHLHFEILKDSKQVDPATYLTFEEK